MEKAYLKKFQTALESSHGALNALTKSGKKLIGYFCTYTPLEIIHAAGFIPVRVTGSREPLSEVDAYIPSFTCPYLRSAFESGLNGTYHYLSGIVQGYTCDVACGLINLWKENIDGELFHTVPLPYNDNADSRRYFRSALEELGEKLHNIGGRNINPTIEHSVTLYESIRRRVGSLYEKRYNGLLPLSGREFYSVIQAGFVLPPEDYFELLNHLDTDLENANAQSVKDLPILISGSLVEDPLYFDMIEASGGYIAGDDLCTGLRQFDQPVIDQGDPIDRIMERHFKRLPCPSRSRAVQRAECLKSLAVKSGSRGVIFLFQKFCTPHLADYPVIKELLDQEGLQSILLEMDETGILEGQVRTRLEGFFEVVDTM